jgi:transposase
VTVVPLSRLPRRCPRCGNLTIVGHGLRRRSAYDDRHQVIRIRRGRCVPCRKTFTILPYWLPPSALYTLRCRRQACRRIQAGESMEQAAPDCMDPDRSPDPCTLRRWAHRRLLSVWCWLKTGPIAGGLLQTPTIIAWDLIAACRILPSEVSSP